VGSIFLILASFLASAVEMVEALTIVLAVGVTRLGMTALMRCERRRTTAPAALAPNAGK